MRQKSTEKHTQKKSAAPRPRGNAVPSDNLPGLGPVHAPARLTPDGHATTLQILKLLPGIDEPKLRALGNPAIAASLNPATGAPWVPKPIAGRWPIERTIGGVIAWLRHTAASRPGLPDTFGSILDFERATGWPGTMIDYALANGKHEVRDSSNRIHFRPFREFFGPKFAVLFASGGSVNIDSPELSGLNLDQQRAELTREQKIAAERDNALANEQIHLRTELEREIMIQRLAPLREGLQAVTKKGRRYAHTQPGIFQDIVLNEIPAFLRALEQGWPELAQTIATRAPLTDPADWSI